MSDLGVALLVTATVVFVAVLSGAVGYRRGVRHRRGNEAAPNTLVRFRGLKKRISAFGLLIGLILLLPLLVQFGWYRWLLFAALTLGMSVAGSWAIELFVGSRSRKGE